MLRIEGLHKAFGSRALLDGVTAHVRPNDRIGLVGRNGEGKTTLLRLIAGVDNYDDGRIVLRRGARIGYLQQEVHAGSERSVIDEVRVALEPLKQIEDQIRALEEQISHAGEQALRADAGDGRVSDALSHRYDQLRHEFEIKGGFEAEANLRSTLTGLGFAQKVWSQPLSTLSGGWLMRVELAKLLLARPEVLLLDEPTNHLDLPSIRWFEDVLSRYEGAVVVVSHDRTFLDRHATRIFELERGRLTAYSGNYSGYERSKSMREQESASRVDNLDKQISHAQHFVDRFGSKATKAKQANSRKLLIEKLKDQRSALLPESARKRIQLRFKPVARSGDAVLRMESIAKSYGDTVVYSSLDFEMRRGDRIALVGPNGAGKTTLLRIAAGAIEFDSGTRELGHNVIPALYAQHQLEALDPNRTALAELEAHAPLDEIPRLRGLLGAFLFSGDDVDKRVRVLSGGEKARLALAKLLLGRANFLILDEPTNHLDMQAREVITGALERFDGTLLFISHDRTLINALANRVLEISPSPAGAGARTEMLIGDFDAYEAKLDSAAGTEGTGGASGGPRGRNQRAARADERQRARETRRELRTRRDAFAAVEADIEHTESAWQANNAASSDPETARNGERMRELTRERRELEANLTELNERWERLGAELESLEAAEASP